MASFVSNHVQIEIFKLGVSLLLWKNETLFGTCNPGRNHVCRYRLGRASSLPQPPLIKERRTAMLDPVSICVSASWCLKLMHQRVGAVMNYHSDIPLPTIISPDFHQ